MVRQRLNLQDSQKQTTEEMEIFLEIDEDKIEIKLE